MSHQAVLQTLLQNVRNRTHWWNHFKTFSTKIIPNFHPCSFQKIPSHFSFPNCTFQKFHSIQNRFYWNSEKEKKIFIHPCYIEQTKTKSFPTTNDFERAHLTLKRLYSKKKNFAISTKKKKSWQAKKTFPINLGKVQRAFALRGKAEKRERNEGDHLGKSWAAIEGAEIRGEVYYWRGGLWEDYGLPRWEVYLSGVGD